MITKKKTGFAHPFSIFAHMSVFQKNSSVELNNWRHFLTPTLVH